MLRHRLLDPRPELLFPLHAFGPVLLHQVGTGHGLLQVRLEPQVGGEVFVRQAEIAQGRRDLGEHFGDPRLDIGLRVVDHHIHPMGKEQRRPGAADDARADDGGVLVTLQNGFIGCGALALVGHGPLLRQTRPGRR